MRIYLSGPMTGQKDLNRKAFADIAFTLQSKGHFVINPHDLSSAFGTAEEIAYSFQELYLLEDGGYASKEKNDDAEDDAKLARAVMETDLAALRTCDAIYLLKGWENSRGAKKELAEAIAHGLIIKHEGGCYG